MSTSTEYSTLVSYQQFKLKGMNFSAFEVVLHNFMYVCIGFSAVSLDPGWNARHDMRRQNTLMADVWIFF